MEKGKNFNSGINGNVSPKNSLLCLKNLMERRRERYRGERGGERKREEGKGGEGERGIEGERVDKEKGGGGGEIGREVIEGLEGGKGKR